MAKMELILPDSAAANQGFIATIFVEGGRPDSAVTVSLRQTRGAQPLWQAEKQVTLDGQGNGHTVFDDIKCQGGRRATFVASAKDDAFTLFKPDAESLEVIE